MKIYFYERNIFSLYVIEVNLFEFLIFFIFTYVTVYSGWDLRYYHGGPRTNLVGHSRSGARSFLEMVWGVGGRGKRAWKCCPRRSNLSTKKLELNFRDQCPPVLGGGGRQLLRHNYHSPRQTCHVPYSWRPPWWTARITLAGTRVQWEKGLATSKVK